MEPPAGDGEPGATGKGAATTTMRRPWPIPRPPAFPTMTTCYRITSAGRDFLVVDGYRIPIDPPADQIDDLLPRHLLFSRHDGSDPDRCHLDGIHVRTV
jgi:hypothetical protein